MRIFCFSSPSCFLQRCSLYSAMGGWRHMPNGNNLKQLLFMPLLYHIQNDACFFLQQTFLSVCQTDRFLSRNALQLFKIFIQKDVPNLNIPICAMSWLWIFPYFSVKFLLALSTSVSRITVCKQGDKWYEQDLLDPVL